MLITGGVLCVVGGLVLVAWSILGSTEALASDPMSHRLGARGARLFHLAEGALAIALGMLMLLSGINS